MHIARILYSAYKAYSDFLQRREEERRLERYTKGYLYVCEAYFILGQPLDYIEDQPEHHSLGDRDEFDAGLRSAILDLRQQLRKPFETGLHQH